MLKAPLFIRAVIAIRGTTPANRAKNWWTGEDSNLRSPQGAADLQSAGFSHSPTRPAKRFGTQRSSRIARTEPDCCTGLLCNAEKARVHRHQPQRFCREESVRIPTSNSGPSEISWRRDLNPRPSDYKSDALPAELRQPCQTERNYHTGNRIASKVFRASKPDASNAFILCFEAMGCLIVQQVSQIRYPRMRRYGGPRRFLR